jgi:cellulose synthase/poly-beta-1,6-N-acetylglucosamine synthase-like glycosyltransferase
MPIHFETSDKDAPKRPQVKGKFFYVGDEKLYIRGVTYGTFRQDDSGNEFHNPEVVEKDFAQMAANGINVVRIYTAPPTWLLDIALQNKLYVMVGLPWEQHVTFLDSRKTARSIENRIRTMIREIAGHPALFCYVIGNEIPSPIVRWHGRRKIERYLKRLYFIAKKEDADGLVTYVNYPTTEYLQLPFLDFHCFNVYLEEQDQLKSYLSRLQNISGDLPLVIGEIGLDSRRNGEEKQAEVLDWQIRTAFYVGCAGAIVFGWTDEWYRGGNSIEDWDFGLTDRNRHPKNALQSVKEAFAEVPFPPDFPWPRISIVVCCYNGADTIRNCLESLVKLDYPNYEVIVVNDGSTDETVAIVKEYDFRLISIANQGLSNARNVGFESAAGEIVAYIDDDAFPDEQWLKYIAAKFHDTDCAGVGGPNIAPLGDGKIADCITNAPGGPMHVLVSDQEAEHIPGCNMAFRKDCLKAIGGFDQKFKIAGDDVDLCWRIREYGMWLAFSPAAKVWHRRRNSILAYWRQQKQYGKAEALLEKKWPQKYNDIGHIPWNGRIYGKGLTKRVGWRNWRIYYGTGGCAPFQFLYRNNPSFLQSLPLIPEWYLVCFALLVLSIFSLVWKPLLMALPLFVIALCVPLMNAIKSMAEASFTSKPLSSFDQLKMRFLTGLLHMIQPVARLYGRLLYGLTPWRWHRAPYYVFPWPRKYKIWSENWQTPDNWLQSIKAAIAKKGAIVKQGGNFDHWDLEIRSGLFGTVRSQMAVEEHGAGKQLLRFRTWPIVSPIGLSLILLFALLSLLAANDQVWLIAILLILVAAGLSISVYRGCAAATGICQQVLRAPEELKNDDVKINKSFILRKKVREGNKFVNFDRRQNNDLYYSGPERRSSIDRRGGFTAGPLQQMRRR